MIVLNDDYRFLKKNKVKEGGLARNEAIISWLRNNVKEYKEISLKYNRFINCILVFFSLLFSREQDIYMLYPTVGVPIHKNGLLGNVIARLFLNCLKYTSEKNNVFIDICDLKYEQAVDLEIEKQRWNCIAKFEQEFFKLDLYFIFASEAMRVYAISKYDINSDKTSVLINGGLIRQDKEIIQNYIEINDERIKVVYAGSLNKGRQIEEMINVIKNSDRIVLYLLGVGGEWIKSDNNVKYLGEFEEKIAHSIVAKCDIGLIPYDENRLYYNIAYPTKLSFYLTAGIPFLSTEVKEVCNIAKKYGIGYTESMDKWIDILNQLDDKTLLEAKHKVKYIKNFFIWDNICAENELFKKFVKEK